MNLDNGLGDIGLPLKETSRSAQSRRALEKDNLGASIGGEDIDELSQEGLGRERAAVDGSRHHITGFDRAAISIAKSNEILHGSDAEQKQGTLIQIGFADEGPEGYGAGSRMDWRQSKSLNSMRINVLAWRAGRQERCNGRWPHRRRSGNW